MDLLELRRRMPVYGCSGHTLPWARNRAGSRNAARRSTRMCHSGCRNWKTDTRRFPRIDWHTEIDSSRWSFGWSGTWETCLERPRNRWLAKSGCSWRQSTKHEPSSLWCIALQQVNSRIYQQTPCLPPSTCLLGKRSIPRELLTVVTRTTSLWAGEGLSVRRVLALVFALQDWTR